MFQRHVVIPRLRCQCHKSSLIRRCHRPVSTAHRINKKDISGGLARAYESQAVEKYWYEWWESQGHFQNKAKPASAPVFSMLLPPPNVTGTLHLGHALTCTIQDVFARWRRMRGEAVTWIPGSDHAGIATQAVVERYLAQENNNVSHLSRERHLEEAWRWRKDKGSIIMKQLRQLGASLDWCKEFFTLDERQNLAVREAFVRLHQAGLVYRSETLVNWSCTLRSAIADVEVEWQDLDGPTMLRVPGHEQPVQFGSLTYVALPLMDKPNTELVVATTRVETMLGDVAVAVHPEDLRYASFIGRHVKHPLRGDRPIPIIADSFVDRSFGTGVVKITPAHDVADFEVAQRHSLPCESVITENGTISSQFAEFAGLSRFTAREVIQLRLGQLGLLRGTSPLKSARVPVCSRSGDIVEMLLRPQWFIRCKDMAAQAMDAVTRGDLIIDPVIFHKVWFDWLSNIRDWCVSRQLWWGHQVPAYFCRKSSTDSESEGIWVVARDEQEARTMAVHQLGTSQIEMIQDTDVLDTWFSSALLPFSSLGWPDNNSTDLRTLFPLSLMETGHDILFFWVARMVMLSVQLTGHLPFKKVLLHGVICDTHGRKMSKSLGNVIHPEDVINGASLELLIDRTKKSNKASGASPSELERALVAQKSSFPQGIPACGTDALRFTLVSHNAKAHTVTFDIRECHTNRLFCNKVWQASRFVLAAVEQHKFSSSLVENEQLELMERWILSRQALAVQCVETALQTVNLYEATAALKDFLYGEFCDVYLECSKSALKDPKRASITVHTLVTCLSTSLHLLSPFMPFLCEELYQHLPCELQSEHSIHQNAFPSTEQWSRFRDEDIERKVDFLLAVKQAINKLKAETGTSKTQAKVRIELPVESNESEELRRNITIVNTLAPCIELDVCYTSPDFSSFEVLSATCKVHLLGQHGTNPKILLKKEKIEKEINKLSKMLIKQGYKEKTPEHLQTEHIIKLERLQAELKKLISLTQKL